MSDRILVIDPDPDLRHRQQITASELGFEVIAVDGAERAFEQIEAAEPDVILCDAFAPGTDDLDLVWQLARRAPEAALFVTSTPEDREAALEIAIRGAHDHLSKPLRASELRLRLRNARERAHLTRQHRLLDAEIDEAIGERPIVAASSPMIRLLESVERAATDGRPVLLTGESGTGKEVIARAIHALSSRRQQSFAALRCAERPADAIRLELLGDPAARSRLGERSQRGLLRDLASGTLYVDEIGALPAPLQHELLALLRAQQDESAAPKRPPRNDVRIIAASAQRLDEAVSRREFSAELLEQLGALRLELPALRERRADIPLLVDHFIDHYRRELAKPVRAIAEDALQQLVAYPWPGNIRELKNAIEAAVMLAAGVRIGTEDLPPRIALAPAADGAQRADLSLKRGRRNCEIDIIRRALRATGGNRTHAARRLEISHRALLYKIKEYGIDA